MSVSTQPIKGARDFYPEDMRLQNYIFDVWRHVCQLFGYEEYDAPILESTELYLNKGNQEIIDEQTYTFKDRGDRSLTVRTEMTPSVSRMVAARRQELAYPQRLFSMPQCWRYERMQRGRGREFYQLNADVFGLEGLPGDQEVIELSDAVMQKFGAQRSMYQIKINSRKLMDDLLNDVIGLNETQTQSMRALIDKKAKVEPAEFTAKLDAILSPTQREAGKGQQLLDFLDNKNLANIPKQLKTHESVSDLQKLITNLKDGGITNAVYDPSLMRGFDYYTDIAFEVFDTDPENNRSMFGGGRYEGLVGMFGVAGLTAVGFGMGDITLKNFLEAHGLMPDLKPTTELYVLGLCQGASKIVQELRQMNIKVAFDNTGRKLDKQLKSAAKLGIRYVLFVGDKELKDEQFTLKDLKTGDQETHSLQRVVSQIADYRDRD